MLVSLLLSLQATPSPSPTKGPAAACSLAPQPTTVDPNFSPPDPAVQVRVTTPAGRTLLLTDTDQNDGLSSFHWRGQEYCLGYGANSSGTFIMVRGDTDTGQVLLGASGPQSAQIHPKQWRRGFGRLALEVQAEALPQSPQ